MRLNRKTISAIFVLSLAATAAHAIDFGGHVGYFGNDVKKAYLGVDLAIPFGMFALMPNIDYTRSNGIGLWYGNIDGAVRFTHTGGQQFFVGAGPTYGYITGYGSSSGRGYSVVTPFQYGGGNPGTGGPGAGSNPGTGGGIYNGSLAPGFNGNSSAWGWDVNAGVSFGTMLRPYVTVRYDKVKNVKATGIAVGLRFGH